MLFSSAKTVPQCCFLSHGSQSWGYECGSNEPWFPRHSLPITGGLKAQKVTFLEMFWANSIRTNLILHYFFLVILQWTLLTNVSMPTHMGPYNEVKTILLWSTATVIWTHIIDFVFSAVLHPICRRTSAEVKSYIQDRCYALVGSEHRYHIAKTS